MTAPTAEDYAAAAALIEVNAAALVRNDDVNPTWLGDTGRFWYERAVKGGSTFVVVDAKTGETSPAVDHDAVAAALSVALEPEEALTGEALGLSAPTFADDLASVTATFGGKRATIDLAEHTVELVDAPTPPTGLLRSPAGNVAVTVTGDNLVLVDLSSGHRTPLTTDGEPYHSYGTLSDGGLITIPMRKTGMVLPPVGAEFSPDGRFLICPRIDERNVAVDPYIEYVPTDGSLRPVVHELRRPYTGEHAQPGSAWFVFDVRTGVQRRIQLPLDLAPSLMGGAVVGWSVERAQAFVLTVAPASAKGALLRVDLTTGECATVIEETAATTRFEPNTNMYHTPNVLVLGDGAEVVWYSDRSGYGHLYRYDAQTGEALGQLTDGDWMVLDIHHVDEGNRSIYLTANGREEGVDPYYRHLYRVNLDGGGVELLTGGDSLHHHHRFAPRPIPMFAMLFGVPEPGQKIAPSVRTFLDTHSTVDIPPVTVLRSLEDGAVIAEIERADVSDLLEAGYVAPTRHLVKAADGQTDIVAVYYPPTRELDGGRHPVIDAVYGGPQVTVVPPDYMAAVAGATPSNRAAHARLGFAVVVVDGRGTPQRGNAFRDAGFPNFTEVGIEDHIAAIRQLAALHPEMDLDRVGIHGWSWGGTFSAQAIITRSDFYSVCVTGAGVYDYSALYPGFEASVGPPVYADGSNVASSASDKPSSWEPLDITSMVDRLDGHMMIVWGDADENVPPLQAYRLIDALTKANKRYDALCIPNGTHTSSSQASNPYTSQRTFDYFVEHLLGAKPPDAEAFTIAPRRMMRLASAPSLLHPSARVLQWSSPRNPSSLGADA